MGGDAVQGVGVVNEGCDLHLGAAVRALERIEAPYAGEQRSPGGGALLASRGLGGGWGRGGLFGVFGVGGLGLCELAPTGPGHGRVGAVFTPQFVSLGRDVLEQPGQEFQGFEDQLRLAGLPVGAPQTHADEFTIIGQAFESDGWPRQVL